MDGNGIYKALAAVTEEIGAIGKNQKNKGQGFMFRGIDDLMNALNPVLAKNKVFIVPDIQDQKREERKTSNGTILIYSICKIKYTFYTDDGSNLHAIVIGEGMDSGDKSTNKAMSAAFKYACFQVFCIPTEEIKDADSESYEVEDRYITEEEKIALENAAARTGMKLDKALQNIKVKDIKKLPVTVYTKWMIKLANQESLPPPTPDGAVEDISEEQSDLPFK
ncbi:MAG: ERF family protein [Clostridium sp.]|nr:ERF family protein [Clostridiales bacterium]MDU3109521.1 ERF family protein [Clostridium sp.]